MAASQGQNTESRSALLVIADALGLLSKPWDPLADLFPQQRAFALDPARRKTALCTRRAGKTHAIRAMLHRQCLSTPNSLCVYIGLTRLSAKRILWAELNRDNAKRRLGISFNHSELIATYPNGSQIVVTGASDAADIEKLRGSAYHLVVIDEAASFPAYFETLVNEVVSPALLDHKGTLALVGTPGPLLSGLFYEATAGDSKGWSRHAWSILDNTLGIPDAAAEIELEKQRRGWNEQTPAFLREYRGRWVRSDDSLLYHYDAALNDCDPLELPKNENWHHVLGVDMGWHDHTALVVGAWHAKSPDWHVLHSESAEHLLPSVVAAKIKALRAQYPLERIVMDTGGLGKSIAQEFIARHQLPIEAADKREKASAIEWLNEGLRLGQVKCEDGSPLAEQWKVLQRAPKGLLEHPAMKADLADAALYAYRWSRPYLYRPPPPPKTLVDFDREVLERERREVRGELDQNADPAWWQTEEP